MWEICDETNQRLKKLHQRGAGKTPPTPDLGGTVSWEVGLERTSHIGGRATLDFRSRMHADSEVEKLKCTIYW